MKVFVSAFVFGAFFVISFAGSLLATPLTGSGTLPLPPLGNPPRNTYAPAGPAAGPFTGTWPGGGPNIADPAWWGTFSAIGPMPHGAAGPVGTALYNFTLGGGYVPGACRSEPTFTSATWTTARVRTKHFGSGDSTLPAA